MKNSPFANNSSIKLNIKRSDLPGIKPAKMDPADALLEFASILSSAGLNMLGIPTADGVLHRVSVNDDKGRKKSGWYILHDGEFMSGAYGNWKTGGDTCYWSSISTDSMSAAQITEFQRQREIAKIKRQEEQKNIWTDAAREAKRVWDAGKDISHHPYLTKKKLANGGKISQSKDNYIGWLMVPAFDVSGNISTIQFISNSGEKRFMTSGKKTGNYYITNGEQDEIYVAEGYATAETITNITGKSCAVAWDAGNLMPVCENIRSRFPNSIITIAGDNDHENEVNTGYDKASACATALGLRAIFPICVSGESDFNDIYVNYGADVVRDMILEKSKEYDNSKNKAYSGMPTDLLNPPGILSDIVNYYNATARAPQPGFAVQTALALGSVVCGRRYKTTKSNFSSLYFLNIAKSGTGKENIKTVIERILDAVGQGYLVNGGYTSSGAIFSALIKSPRHVTIIDEFGLFLGNGKIQNNVNQKEVQGLLLETFGRTHGVLRPKTYSTMTRGKGDDDLNDRRVYNPAVTLVGMTTPSTFYENISGGSISDGFIGRFIIHQSNLDREVHDEPDEIKIPSRIIEWLNAITERAGVQFSELSDEVPKFNELSFDNASLGHIKDFYRHQINLQNSLDEKGLGDLPSRIKEMSMKMALIVALAKNPHAEIIDSESTSWAIKYVKFAMDQTISAMKMNVSSSPFEASKKEILAALRQCGSITWKDAQKRPPFSKYNRKDLAEILGSLQAGELADMESVVSGRGRPAQKWFAVQKK